MKFALKLLVCAILSFSVGIACASPLLVSELSIRPWIHYVQGPTAQMNIQVIYANFTVKGSNDNTTQESGHTIAYCAVVNITNPTDYEAYWSMSQFSAADKIKREAFLGNGSQNWFAEGAWIDGKWYNVSWVGDSLPVIDANGQLTEVHYAKGGYWMEGVEIYDTYHNGNITATYLNMNGTWTDVTGKIEVERNTDGASYSMSGVVANQMQFFDNIAVREYSSDGTAYDESSGPYQTVFHLVGQAGYFNNTWGPHESRLIEFSGSWNLPDLPVDLNSNVSPIAALNTGKLILKTEISSDVPSEISYGNNSVTTTQSTAVEEKQITLTSQGNSYIFSPLGLTNDDFTTDKWGLEVHLTSGGFTQ